MKTLYDEIQLYRPAVTLGKILGRNTQSILRLLFLFAAIALAILGVWGAALLPQVPVTLWWGAALLSGSLWLDQLLTFGYHNSYYFRGLADVDEGKTMATYDVAEVVLQHETDVTRAFCESIIGKNVLMRSRILPKAIEEFLQSERRHIPAEVVSLPEQKVFSLIDLGSYLLNHDSDFEEIFTRHGINPQLFIRSLEWVVGTHHQQKRRLRWWSKENLSKTTGLGREWSYGTAFMLERFTRDIRTSAVFSTLTNNPSLAEEKISEIEQILTKGKGANALIIGEAGVGKMDLVLALQKRMNEGTAIDSIIGNHIYVLDTNRLFAVHHDKSQLEQSFLRLFSEAAAAGNTIIAIENLSTVVKEAEQYGVYLPELLDEFLAFPDLHVIATDTPGAYHQILEPLGGFIRRFSEIQIESADQSATTRVLEGVALTTEVQKKVIFTYEGLEAITSAADRYIVEGVMPDKAITLLLEVANAAAAKEQILITSDLVYQVVSEKTNVPAGPIKDSERDLLMNLESVLHHQVVGQDSAINAIASTMRRARAGIQSEDKPIGSFLFLGPTGVGKTETAKALASVFFGSPDKMERIDMSEFSGPDALVRLIGDSDQSGALSDRLREHPYSVLLLDEFEKAAVAVHDLFLQILDEGVFTDGRGTTVNARNTIIIATSNAGADIIMKTVRERSELSHLTHEIIDHIIAAGIYKPELINRFDNTIIFEPLNISEQSQVASLLLKDLYTRIKAKGYQLHVGAELMEILVQKGYDPRFGARPMQRVLQDMLEEKVAERIINGTVAKGDTISLTKSDFTAEELST
jgi:ATP-dependent Clp protease ATP-binding subunit ClpC